MVVPESRPSYRRLAAVCCCCVRVEPRCPSVSDDRAARVTKSSVYLGHSSVRKNGVQGASRFAVVYRTIGRKPCGGWDGGVVRESCEGENG